jgi:hypothetical protein
MKTLIRIVVCLTCALVLLASAGCQAVEKQAAEPEVVAQGTVSCDIENFSESFPLLIQTDSQLGRVERGYVIRHSNRCAVTYLDGDYVGIQDEWHTEDSGGWSTMMEIATNEGGIWKGTHVVDNDLMLKGSYSGDGMYKGVTKVNEQ